MDSFVFYRSFYEALKDMPAPSFKKAVCALAEYALDGAMSEELKGASKVFFTLARPQIDANRARYEKAEKGGRKKKELPSADELRALHVELGTWDAVANHLGVSRATVLREVKVSKPSQKSVKTVSNQSQISKPNYNVNSNSNGETVAPDKGGLPSHLKKEKEKKKEAAAATAASSSKAGGLAAPPDTTATYPTPEEMAAFFASRSEEEDEEALRQIREFRASLEKRSKEKTVAKVKQDEEAMQQRKEQVQRDAERLLASGIG